MPGSREFLKKHGLKIITAAGLILVAILSFEAGYMKGQEGEARPIVIEKPAPAAAAKECPPAETAKAAGQAQTVGGSDSGKAPAAAPADAKNCAFVGSKNSTKYHLPDCQWARRIKPENLVCFSSAEDAAAKGYQPDKNCVK